MAAGEGLGNRFLHGIREVDAICYVLRAFEDEDVIEPGPGGLDLGKRLLRDRYWGKSDSKIV